MSGNMDMSKHIKVLTCEEEWPLWKRKIRDLLDYHEGALDAIDGKLVKIEQLEPTANAEQRKMFKEQNDLYRKANSYAKSMIASAVSDTVYQKIMDKETAKDAWEALKQHFEATSKDQLFKICSDFFSFCWSSSEDASTHIAKLRGLWNELNNGLKARDEESLPDLILVCKILNILPSTFETFKSSWMLLTKDEDRTFDELTTQLCMFERNFRKTDNKDSTVQEALTAKTNKPNQGGKGIKNKKRSKKEDICHYCKKKGHWLTECRDWIAHGRPVKKKEESNTQSNILTTNVALTSDSGETYTIDISSEDWWIDNGATRHMTNCSKYFINFEAFDEPYSVKAAGKEVLNALGTGSIQCLSTLGDTNQKLTLKDVWYVPRISRNLFSVLATQDKNLNSEFKSTTTECWLKVDEKEVLYGQREIGGTLYKAAIKSVKPDSKHEVNVAVADDSLLQLYHERWGHQDKHYVKNMIEKELGIKVISHKKVCEPCMYGKAHRLPFGTRGKATKPGELMSADVCGPFDTSFQKNRYLVVFKDSYTKFRYGYIIKEKSEVKTLLKNMLAHIKTLGHTVKELLSDNGGEFDNEDIKKILSENGIMQRLTAPYTPQQNGGSERENRTIVEMARTLKYSNPEADFPSAIWAELVTSAIYILNRTGKSSVKGITPYELWIGKKPRIKHLRIIGSVCYAHIPGQKRRKMDKKAIKGYLVGYDADERYRIWIKERHKVILSRDVEFLEKPSDCNEVVKLPLRNLQIENQQYSTGEISKDDNEEFTEDEGESDSEYKEKNDLENFTENRKESENKCQGGEQNKSESSSSRCLRDKSTLKKPTYLEDYVLIAENLMNIVDNPETYNDAINSEKRVEWKRAMDNEMTSLKENQTWELVNLPKGAKAIPSKWVFRIKTKPNGEIERYKARLVVKGFGQRQGIDYSQTFSPVAKLGTVRSILSIAANEGLFLKQFDVSTAFLYGELEEVIYMEQPEGFNDGTQRVCRLKRSLYGLKQAPRCWNKRFGSFLVKLGFKPSEADPCLYIRKIKNRKLLLALYVDDGLLAASNQEDLEIFLQELKKEFKITTQPANYFLGLEIKYQTDKSIKISQTTYAKKVLERFNFSECKPISTPMLKGTETSEQGKGNVEKQNFPYRQAIGALMYLMLGTRPDLAYAIGFMSRSLENPSREDIARVKRVFRYIAGTIDLGIVYSSCANKGTLQCYSDADFGGCTKTGRSTSGVVITYAGGAISWLSQRQAMVATSTTEAEIVAANEAAKEIIWLSRLYEGIQKLKNVPILQVDNSAAVRLAQNPEFHRRTKHIAIKHFFIREKISEGNLDIQLIPTEHQVADMMTKPLPNIRLKMLSNKLGLQ